MEAFVDQRGMAHDDEGNSWFVGKRWDGFVGPARILPEPPRPSRGHPTQRTVTGSFGHWHNITTDSSGKVHCTCKGFRFRRTCKHI